MPMKLTNCIALTFLLAGLTASLYCQNYSDSDIAAKNKGLQSIKSKIKQKKSEKERCLADEKRISAELDSVYKELEKNRQQGEKIRREIIRAEKKLKAAEKELNASRWEKNKWARNLNSEIDRWYRENYSYNKLFEDNIDEKIRIQALEQKKALFSNALQREKNWQKALWKWQKAQKNLRDLKAKQEATAKKKSAILAQKKTILSTTIGRRLNAEKEIKELSQSAEALSDLISKLEREREREIEREREQAGRHKKKTKKPKVWIAPVRRSISWPVHGNVIAKFGKNKHPELDTYQISNGIKISARAGAEVKAAYKGEIVFTGQFRAYGLLIVMDNGEGLYTIYGHLGAINAEENAKVNEGDPIGQVSSENPVLYFEVRYKGQPDDPLLWLNR